ncbi:potassium channel family protein [Pustulibacterium marinum]|nr:potassium channel family protein [Pustulibacterium marinum]
MRYLLILFFLCTGCYFGFAQHTAYTTYSYSEFVAMMQQEQDSVFYLKNALIDYNPETDSERFKDVFGTNTGLISDSRGKIVIDKVVELENVQFLAYPYSNDNGSWINGVLKDIHFKKDVNFTETNSLHISSCIFDGQFMFYEELYNEEDLDVYTTSSMLIQNSTFNQFFLFKNRLKNNRTDMVNLVNNVMDTHREKNNLVIEIYNTGSVIISGNTLKTEGAIQLNFESESVDFLIKGNDFISKSAQLTFEKIDTRVNITENTFSAPVKFYTEKLDSKDQIDWNQFENHLIAAQSYYNFARSIASSNRKNLTERYLDSIRYYNKSIFVNEIGLKGMFYDYYRSRYDIETANEVYMELKDFETKRMQIRYQKDPSFKRFFTWKVNQFLKVFSSYGTEPARAIIVSLYVIMIFAFIYLFFPNTWDVHGKKRIMDRYTFFFTYMNKEAGMHEVYLANKQEFFLEFQDFKLLLEKNGTKVPRFFMVTALPLYNWAISGTKLSARILKKLDFMKGRWQDLPKKKKRWKTWLVILVFIIAIAYDIFIKILNALMLSINTFTTLGFGEIPIKGLPRYLAIVQGFIGWFMLTIFSVSLISQLLN